MHRRVHTYAWWWTRLPRNQILRLQGWGSVEFITGSVLVPSINLRSPCLC
jgi:hypothetical protein